MIVIYWNAHRSKKLPFYLCTSLLPLFLFVHQEPTHRINWNMITSYLKNWSSIHWLITDCHIYSLCFFLAQEHIHLIVLWYTNTIVTTEAGYGCLLTGSSFPVVCGGPGWAHRTNTNTNKEVSTPTNANIYACCLLPGSAHNWWWLEAVGARGTPVAPSCHPYFIERMELEHTQFIVIF